MGHTGRAEARWLLPKICEAGNITKDGIGAIRVREDETFVQISEELASRFGPQSELEPDLTMTRLEGQPSLDRPAPSFSRDKPRHNAKPSGPRKEFSKDKARAPGLPKPLLTARANLHGPARNAGRQLTARKRPCVMVP